MQIFVFPTHSAVVVCDNKMLKTFSVCIRVVEYAVTWATIATCSAYFLSVILQTFWKCCMNDKPNITFIYSHSEGNRCNYNMNLIPHPPLLDILPRSVRHPCMIEITLYLVLAKLCAQLFTFKPR